jgi:hypothetical protein
MSVFILGNALATACGDMALKRSLSVFSPNLTELQHCNGLSLRRNIFLFIPAHSAGDAIEQW